MATALLPTSLLESIGIQAVKEAAALAFPSGALTIGDPGSGIEVDVKLSADQTLHIEDLSLSGGLSGHIYIDGLATDPLKATLFDGFAVSLSAFDLTFAQSGLAASHVGGSLTIPFFTNSAGQPNTVDIEITTKSDGSISISVAAAQSSQSTTSDGLIQLHCPLPGSIGTVELDVASLEIDKAADGTWAIIISGNLIIDAAGLNFPTISLQGLGIDTKGHVSLKGGWIDLPSQTALDFFGFHVGLQKLGFGNDPNGDRWIGFNGDISLVEGISLGGSVRGLRINLTTGSVSLDGVSISFELPDVLSIDGEIDHIHVDATSAKDFTDAGLNGSLYSVLAPHGGPASIDVFAGSVKVVIYAAGSLEVDATFIAGTFQGQSVFFLDLDCELPVGIPLFLDVSLWGIQGLVATGLEPEPEPQRTWWEWYKYTDTTDTTTDFSATDVNKWINSPKPGAFAIGGGVTIGTEFDDGFTVSAAIMLVVLLPGPVISLIGKANILSKRIGGASQDANFEAMATFDGTSDTFDLVIEAQYSIPIVLDIHATAELYVGGDDWYFAMGKPPKEKRVSARIFDLFETDAYFVISNKGLVTGTWTGYKNSWSFGPLSASLDAYLATLAAIQWSPFQIGGGIELYGNVHLSAFGIGVGLTADALLEGTAPNPFYVHGELSVELDLPWPLPNIGATISLTWGGDDGSVPPAPLALGHIDATLIDHCDANAKPASDHYTLLAHRSIPIQPDLVNNVPLVYDDTVNKKKPGILDLEGSSLAAWQTRAINPSLFAGFTPDNSLTSPQMAPVIPQDSHLTLNFSHPTQDSTGFSFHGAIPYTDPKFPLEVVTPAPPPASVIGADDLSNINPDPPQVGFTIRHSLTEVALYQWDGSSTWDLIYTTANPVPAVVGGPTVFTGVWLQGDPTKTDSNSIMTQLKIVPYNLLPPAAEAKDAIKLPILPDAPALYALRAVTRIEAARVGTSGYQTVHNGYPIVEYTYFQTAAGPGTAVGVPPPQVAPVPSGPAPFLQLATNCNAQQQPNSAFPVAGALDDLTTYTQWSWPLNGAVTAYYGYDVSAEFVETYIHNLYARFGNGGEYNVHFRCVDRNNGYTVLVPTAIHVPTVPSNAALVTTEVVPPLPTTIQPASLVLKNPTRFYPVNPALFDVLVKSAASEAATPAPTAVAPAATTHATVHLQENLAELRSTIIRPIGVTPVLHPIATPVEPVKFNPIPGTEPVRTSPVLGPVKPTDPYVPVKPIDPGIGTILHNEQEAAAAAQARAIWFRPLYPNTQYTLDIVAGPLSRTNRAVTVYIAPSQGSLLAIFNAKDAIAAFAALKAFYAYEDSLTTLKRIIFTTSRYATYTAQMANVAQQLAGSTTVAPIRHYPATVDPLTWLEANPAIITPLSTALGKYVTDRNTLFYAGLTLDALADALNIPPAAVTNGNAELVFLRQTVASDWTMVSRSFNTAFDALITALGHPELASVKTPIRVPDTEISLFSDASNLVSLLMLESPEPLPWQRIWQTFTLGSVGNNAQTLIPFWSADGTRALLLVLTKGRGPAALNSTFKGNIGPEAPCIMLNGVQLSEPVTHGSVILGPYLYRPFPPITVDPIAGRPISDAPLTADPLIQDPMPEESQATLAPNLAILHQYFT